MYIRRVKHNSSDVRQAGATPERPTEAGSEGVGDSGGSRLPGRAAEESAVSGFESRTSALPAQGAPAPLLPAPGEFSCSRCGACCRRAGNVPELVALGLAVGGGPCRELQPDGSCGIYVDRPRVCRVDLSRPREVSFASWRKANYDACNTMQREDGMDERWRVG